MAGKRDKPDLASSGIAEVIFARHSDKYPQRVLPRNNLQRVSGSAANA